MEKRKDNLMRWVVGGHGFVRAYHSVLRNKGAAGVDGMQTADLRRHLIFHWENIKTELLNGEYRPQLVGGGENPQAQRRGSPIGHPHIPGQAGTTVHPPGVEPNLREGFLGLQLRIPTETQRTGRPPTSREVHQFRQAMGDRPGFEIIFDRVNQEKLMDLISRKVADKTLLRLIRRYLRSGIMEGGLVQARTEGTPQGGPLSPLLSNILLNELDRELEKRGTNLCAMRMIAVFS